MSNDQIPNIVDSDKLPRALALGLGVAVASIGLFMLLWFALGQTSITAFPRLMLSLCTPPTTLAIVFGVYFLVRGQRSDPD